MRLRLNVTWGHGVCVCASMRAYVCIWGRSKLTWIRLPFWPAFQSLTSSDLQYISDKIFCSQQKRWIVNLMDIIEFFTWSSTLWWHLTLQACEFCSLHFLSMHINHSSSGWAVSLGPWDITYCEAITWNMQILHRNEIGCWGDPRHLL